MPNRALNPTLSASGSLAEQLARGTWTKEYQSPTGLLLRTTATQQKKNTGLVFYCDPAGASPSGAWASALAVTPGETITVALDLACSSGTYWIIDLRFHDGTSWVGAVSSSPQSGIISTGGARISHSAMVPAGAGFLAVAVHPPSDSTTKWTLASGAYIKYDAIDIDGVAASPIGYASATISDPPPSALASPIGYAITTLTDPQSVYTSTVGYASGTIGSGAAWQPTTVTLSGETLVVVARDAGQTLTCGAQQVTSTRPYQALRIVGESGVCTFSPGWWRSLTIVEGDYFGPAFGGDDPGAEWEGDDDASPSDLYEVVTRSRMSEPVQCEVKELQYTLTPGAMVRGRYAQCLSS